MARPSREELAEVKSPLKAMALQSKPLAAASKFLKKIRAPFKIARVVSVIIMALNRLFILFKTTTEIPVESKDLKKFKVLTNTGTDDSITDKVFRNSFPPVAQNPSVAMARPSREELAVVQSPLKATALQSIMRSWL